MITKNIRKYAKIGVLLAGALTLTACGEVVEVPTAHKGKISTKDGLKEGIIDPSKVRLSNMCVVCDNLIIAEVSDYPVHESMTLYMKDNLNLSLDVRGTLATSSDDKDLDMIFSRVSPVARTSRISLIPSSKVYETYAKQVVRERVRSVVSKYTIPDVMANRTAISAEIADEVRTALKGLPVKVLNFGLADMQPPAVIINAEESRKKREIEIAEAEADEQVRIRQAQADLNVAKLQQAVELKQAETDLMVQKKLDEGFNQSFLARRGMQVLSDLAKSENKVIFLPTEALQNPAVMIGVVNSSMEKKGE